MDEFLTPIGGFLYANPPIWRFVETEEKILVNVGSKPGFLRYVAMGIIIVGPCMLLAFFVPVNSGKVLMVLAGITALIGANFFSYYAWKREKEKGDYLALVLATREIVLPRQGKRFSFDQVVCFQLIKAFRVNKITSDTYISQLNVIVKDETGGFERFPVFGGIGETSIDAISRKVADKSCLALQVLTQKFKVLGEPALAEEMYTPELTRAASTMIEDKNDQETPQQTEEQIRP